MQVSPPNRLVNLYRGRGGRPGLEGASLNCWLVWRVGMLFPEGSGEKHQAHQSQSVYLEVVDPFGFAHSVALVRRRERRGYCSLPTTNLPPCHDRIRRCGGSTRNFSLPTAGASGPCSNRTLIIFVPVLVCISLRDASLFFPNWLYRTKAHHWRQRATRPTTYLWL